MLGKSAKNVNLHKIVMDLSKLMEILNISQIKPKAYKSIASKFMEGNLKRRQTLHTKYIKSHYLSKSISVLNIILTY